MLKDRLFGKLFNKNSEERLMLCNQDLLLLRHHDKLKICVVYNEKNKKWIENHFDSIQKLQGEFAVSLDGETIIINSLHLKNKQKVYIKNNEIIDSLFAYSSKSNGTLWTTEKFNSVSKFEKDSKLSFADLLVLQDEINDEHKNINKENKSHEEVETL